MSEIYLWNAEVPNVGHCSLKLSDGTYVSFWPVGNYTGPDYLQNKKVSSQKKSYDHDVGCEGRRPDKVIKLTGTLNVTKAKKWWLDSNEQYCATNECSHMVLRTLEAGDYSDQYAIEKEVEKWRNAIRDKVKGNAIQYKKSCKK